jgi:hypothetical protein
LGWFTVSVLQGLTDDLSQHTLTVSDYAALSFRGPGAAVTASDNLSTRKRLWRQMHTGTARENLLESASEPETIRNPHFETRNLRNSDGK